MSIDFQCPHCEKRLRAADGMAGRKSRCTACQQAVVVPRPSRVGRSRLTTTPRVSPADGIGPPVFEPIRDANRASLAPNSRPDVLPRQTSFIEVFLLAWSIYRRGFSAGVGAVVVYVILVLCFNISFWSVMSLWGIARTTYLEESLNHELARRSRSSGYQRLESRSREPGGAQALAVTSAYSLAGGMIQAFLLSGMLVLANNAARGREVSAFDVLGGGRYALRTFIHNVVLIAPLLLLAVALPLLEWLELWVVMPPLVVILLFAQFSLFLNLAPSLPMMIDRNIGVFEALRQSFRISDVNKPDTIAVLIGLVVLNLFGALLIGIGLFYTLPLTFYTWTALYICMTHDPECNPVSATQQDRAGGAMLPDSVAATGE